MINIKVFVSPSFATNAIYQQHYYFKGLPKQLMIYICKQHQKTV